MRARPERVRHGMRQKAFVVYVRKQRKTAIKAAGEKEERIANNKLFGL
jgi:hypothetical protein